MKMNQTVKSEKPTPTDKPPPVINQARGKTDAGEPGFFKTYQRAQLALERKLSNQKMGLL